MSPKIIDVKFIRIEFEYAWAFRRNEVEQSQTHWNLYVFSVQFQSNLTNAVIPEEHIGYKHSQATFLSKVTFFWLTPLIWQGYRAPLELDDLGTLHESDTCRTQYDRFHFIYKSFKVLYNYEFYSIKSTSISIKFINWP